MTTFYASSRSPSPSGDRTRSRKPRTPAPHRSAPYGRRWWRLFSERHRAALCLSLPPSLSRRSLVARLRRLRRAYTLYRTCVENYDRVNSYPNADISQVHIRKVKLLKAPKFDLGALLNLHGESTTDEQGQKVEREFKETVLESV